MCHVDIYTDLEDFMKTKLVAAGNMTKSPAMVTYASFVSHEMVCTALTIAAVMSKR